MITEDYCGFEIAKLLKEKGFIENCSMRYNKVGDLVEESYKFNWNFQTIDYSAPTLQMVCKWLREKHNIYISIQPDFPSELNYKMCWYWSVSILQENAISLKRYQTYIETYEQATEAAIMYCLEYLI